MPSRNSVTCLPSLSNYCVLADEIDARDMTVEVNPYARPFQARRHLFDMCRLTRAMVASYHDAAIVGETREDGDSVSRSKR